MEIKKFNVVEGLYIEKIPCQDLLAYGIPDNEDFYDVAERGPASDLCLPVDK